MLKTEQQVWTVKRRPESLPEVAITRCCCSIYWNDLCHSPVLPILLRKPEDGTVRHKGLPRLLGKRNKNKTFASMQC